MVAHIPNLIITLGVHGVLIARRADPASHFPTKSRPVSWILTVHLYRSIVIYGIINYQHLSYIYKGLMGYNALTYTNYDVPRNIVYHIHHERRLEKPS